jgi:hypothetical protein
VAISRFVLAWVFRNRLNDLLRSIKKIKHKDTEISFDAEIAEAKAIADSSPSIAPPPKEIIDNRLALLASQYPHLAVAEAWRFVEAELQRMAKSVSRIGYRLNPMQQIDLLKKEEMITEEQASLIADLRVLRNRAVHEEQHEITSGQAIEYIEIASRLQKTLEAKK